MRYYRQKLEVLLLKAMCRLTDGKSNMLAASHLYRTKVLTGPIRGMYFSMARQERVSFALGTYESHIVRYMRRIIRPGAIAYDVGANAGYLSLVMSRFVQSNGRVFAFEPENKNFAALKANIQNNGIENITAIQSAVNDVSGTVTFAAFDYSLVGHIANSSTPSDARLVQVESTSLDDFVYKKGFARPDLIKIDVEGAEDRVMYGADKLLREAKPIIIAEVREGDVYQHIVEFLSDHDYRFEFLPGGWQQQKDHLGDMLFIPNTNIMATRIQT